MSDQTGSSVPDPVQPDGAESGAPSADGSVSVSVGDVAAAIDHTLLAVGATDADVVALCADANRFDVAAICVSPSRLPIATGTLNDSIGVATVCGFPSGSHRPESKAAEAAIEDIATVRGSVPTNLVLKVIIESGALTDDEIVQCCESDETAGGVKASGGVRTWDAAVAMMNAGATRIGTSSTEAILGGAHA